MHLFRNLPARASWSARDILRVLDTIYPNRSKRFIKATRGNSVESAYTLRGTNMGSVITLCKKGSVAESQQVFFSRPQASAGGLFVSKRINRIEA